MVQAKILIAMTMMAKVRKMMMMEAAVVTVIRTVIGMQVQCQREGPDTGKPSVNDINNNILHIHII